MPRLVYVAPVDLELRAQLHDRHADRLSETAGDLLAIVAESSRISPTGPIGTHAARCLRRSHAHRSAAIRLGEENIRRGH